MWAQVWDGHLEGQKNPDRLKRSIHVDRIGVQSTFAFMFASLPLRSQNFYFEGTKFNVGPDPYRKGNMTGN